MTSSRGNIVIVEDDAGLNRALSRLLRVAGFHVTHFESGSSALASGALRQADCLVFDVHLAEMTCYDLKQLLAEDGPSPPVIVITADDDEESRRQAQAMGVAAYLTKPFAGHVLLKEVTRAIGSRDHSVT